MIDRSTPGMGLDCVEVVELVTEYLDAALPQPLMDEVGRHLARCPGCEVYLDQLRRTIAALGTVSVETLSPQAQAELLDAFRTFDPRNRG